MFQLDIDDNHELESFPGAFSQILTNLVINSIIHGFENQTSGIIQITSTKEDGLFRVTFSDNGKGISTEDQKKIFDLFYTTKPPGKGTGLGLPICQNIINNLGGNMTFESQAGEGTTFTVSVPIS